MFDIDNGNNDNDIDIDSDNGNSNIIMSDSLVRGSSKWAVECEGELNMMGQSARSVSVAFHNAGKGNWYSILLIQIDG
jgi:hypothetical protein